MASPLARMSMTSRIIAAILLSALCLALVITVRGSREVESPEIEDITILKGFLGSIGSPGSFPRPPGVVGKPAWTNQGTHVGGGEAPEAGTQAHIYNGRDPRHKGAAYPFPLFLEDGRDGKDEEMMESVKEMMIHAWDSYVQYASPDDELRPVSARGFNWSTTSLLATPVDSLDTLRLMGLESRYQSAKILVLKELKIDADIGVSVFETNIRILGGLLSAWEFDDDPRLLDLAERLAVRLIRALDTPSGMPDRTINLNSGGAEGPPATLAEYGSLQLELQYLADVTGKPHYAKKALRIYEIIQANTTVKGLYPKERGKETFGIGPNADSFYEYLLKIWMATGDAKFRTMYDESAEAINKYLVHHRNGRTYVPDADLRHDTNTVAKHTTSHHLACFAGGMFATGALTRREDNWEQFFQLGKQITQTCWEGYEKTATGLGPEQVGTAFNTDSDGRYMLRPETIESVFYMWRLTREPIYRSMGRVFLTSLNKHCRTDTGFSGLRSVSTLPASLDDVQPSFFLAETLKYLYLLFADDDTIPLEAYVFNTEAHPLSVRGWGRRRGIPRGDVDLGVGRSAGEEL